MLLYTFLYALFGFNLFKVISDEDTIVYKDGRFWLVMFSFVILIVMTVVSLR